MESESKCRLYQKKLGLENEPIIFKSNNQFGGTSWKGNNWVIYYRNVFDILHELGHILLNNDPYNYTHSHSSWIHSFVNNIIDCFDNYNLVTNPKIPEFASLLSDECYDYTTTLWNKISESNPHELLALYCLLFLNWQYIVPNKVKKNRSKTISFTLKKARKAIINGLRLSEDYFDDFITKLIFFNEIKKNWNVKAVSSYILDVLVGSKIANKNSVLNVLKQLIFSTNINKKLV